MKNVISEFLLKNDALRYNKYGIDYFFHMQKNIFLVEHLTPDLYLKLLLYLKADNIYILNITSYGKRKSLFSKLTIFYSVTFEVKP